MEDVNKQAELYAESFRYKVDDGGWYEQKKRDFIAGYEAALSIHDFLGQSEQLSCYHEGRYTLKSDGNCCKCHLPPKQTAK